MRAPAKKAPATPLRRYFAGLPPDTRRALRELRAAIRAAAPGVTDAFSYQIPALRLNGRPFLWYAGWKQHVSIYPIGVAIRRKHADALAGYSVSRGTVRFPLERAIPVGLVKKLVKARLAEFRGIRK